MMYIPTILPTRKSLSRCKPESAMSQTETVRKEKKTLKNTVALHNAYTQSVVRSTVTKLISKLKGKYKPIKS